MTHSRRSSEAPSPEAAGDPAAKVDTAAEASAGEPAGNGDTGKHSKPDGAGKHAAPDEKLEKVHGDPLAEAVKDAVGDNEVAGGTAQSAEIGALRTEIDERVRDLQRITAEYANYRKRVARDQANARNDGIAEVLGVLLPVLDDLDRAREHGDLTGPFGAVADQLVAALGKFGLTPFGSQGDAFDPTRHEAVAHRTSAEVTEPSCVSVMRRGYLLGERLLRPAMVEVADPE
ncbi:nucleotide exchange factor GrpE [Virgisporangium ochraceum]|uniref:Protein GrpE n=1 Tax=Virgisporangium ochraceum TaxID=65505 RepID=A0A8J3ZLM6_9ACTN|nr:protein GrpE [Virgisporangium ochraceum]